MSEQKTKATKLGAEFTRPCFIDSVVDNGQQYILGTYTQYYDNTTRQFKRSGVAYFEIGKEYTNANTMQYLKPGHRVTLHGRLDYWGKAVFANPNSQKIIVTQLDREMDDLQRLKEGAGGQQQQMQQQVPPQMQQPQQGSYQPQGYQQQAPAQQQQQYYPAQQNNDDQVPF